MGDLPRLRFSPSVGKQQSRQFHSLLYHNLAVQTLLSRQSFSRFTRPSTSPAVCLLPLAELLSLSTSSSRLDSPGSARLLQRPQGCIHPSPALSWTRAGRSLTPANCCFCLQLARMDASPQWLVPATTVTHNIRSRDRPLNSQFSLLLFFFFSKSLLFFSSSCLWFWST